MCSGDGGVLEKCRYIVNVPLPQCLQFPAPGAALHCEVVTSPLSPASWTLHWAGQCTAVSRGAGSSAEDCLQQWNHHQTLPGR